MGRFRKNKSSTSAPEPPKLALRRENRKSSFKMGRTISEKRERVETANERAAARKKDKQKRAARILITVVGFIILIIILVCTFLQFMGGGEVQPAESELDVAESYEPTVEIVDESGSHDQISARMRNYIGMVEHDFKDVGLTVTKAVIPSNAIREVDFYLKDHKGYVKMTIDRDSAVSVEDAVRMYHYLEGIKEKKITYIDVRIEGKAYWK